MANKNTEILSAVKSAGEAALRLHEENKSLRERLRSKQNPGLAVRQQAADEIESLRTDYVLLSDDYKQLLGDNERLRSRLDAAQLELTHASNTCAGQQHRAESAEAENAMLRAQVAGYRADIERELKAHEVTIGTVYALRKDAEYYKWRLTAIIPLFQEARDALTAIPFASAKLRGLDLTLADRMDAAGTATRADFDAAMERSHE